MMSNCALDGTRYGVIACNSLDPDLVDELFYGNQAADLSHQEAYAQAKSDAELKYASLLEEASISAAESGADREVGFDLEEYEEKWFDLKEIEYDAEMFVDRELERFSDMCQIDEPSIEGVYQGVTYLIGWLGGAPLLWVIEGPRGWAKRLCSPCVPGAADLDGGFTLKDEDRMNQPEHGCYYECFCVPRDWLYVEVPA